MSRTELGDLVAGLREGECTCPLSLRELTSRAGLRGALRAPALISLDSLEALPPSLRHRELYVIRLGQRHTGRALFTLCRARRGYRGEVIGANEIRRALASRVELSHVPSWAISLAERLGGESLALLATYLLLRRLSGSRETYLLPSVRLGAVRFEFKPTASASTYTYWGQVEIDAVLGADRVHALEAKARVRALFKHKIAFSALALASVLQEPVQPVVAFASRLEGRLAVVVLFLKPPALAGQPYVIEDLRLADGLTVLMPSR